MKADDVFSYDSIAVRYASKVDAAPYNALYERPAMLELLPDVSGASILDAGCGSGWYAERLLERGATVTAIDASVMMIEHARDRLTRLSPDQHSRVAFAHADLNQPLPMSDAAFDGALCPLVLHYVKDWRPV
ncbi:MAG: class I SAM-dependent methyltransferase, partial [Gemmatimonadaceae bacterium]